MQAEQKKTIVLCKWVSCIVYNGVCLPKTNGCFTLIVRNASRAKRKTHKRCRQGKKKSFRAVESTWRLYLHMQKQMAGCKALPWLLMLSPDNWTSHLNLSQGKTNQIQQNKKKFTKEWCANWIIQLAVLLWALVPFCCVWLLDQTQRLWSCIAYLIFLLWCRIWSNNALGWSWIWTSLPTGSTWSGLVCWLYLFAIL